MDDLKTLREELRADTPTPTADDLGALRERLVAETKRAPGRFDWVRGFRFSSPRLLVPALAGALTLALVVGVVIAQGQRNELTVPGPGQWLYVELMLDIPEDGTAGRVTLENWNRADLKASAHRENGGTVTVDDEVPGRQLVLGAGSGFLIKGHFPDLAALYEFYRTALDSQSELYDYLDAQFLEVLGEECRGEWRTRFRNAAECEDAFHTEDRRDAWMMGFLADVLLQPAPVEVDASIYEALRNLPTVREDGVVRDPTGREAVALSTRVLVSTWRGFIGENRLQLIFDPETHRYLGSGSLPTSARADALWTLDISSGIVDEPGEVP